MEPIQTINAALLKGAIELLINKMAAAVETKRTGISQVNPSQTVSAVNLVRYLALRGEDVRSLQNNLHAFGLSSLTSSESHILRQAQAILQRLGQALRPDEISACDYHMGRGLIDTRARQLFGTKENEAIPYLMVTYDVEFVDNYPLTQKLLEAGMNIARINCAHDNEDVWKNMIDLTKTASKKTGIPCKIYMDIAGPKMRTTLLGKGRLTGKVTLFQGREIIMAEADAGYDPAEIVVGCAERGVIKQLHEGDRVFFDDGVIEGKVLSSKDGMAKVKILRLPSRKPQLKEKKGINFPDTPIAVAALTDKDRHSLPFICEHADLAGYSFIRDVSDLKTLQAELAKYSKRPAIILKIETGGAVNNFPALLMQAMREDVFGVMIARGDLAVEIGFERLSEIQEEILWVSEAAHAPVIWATQVLETLNKSGIATRSEVTDASYAAMSECVMVNKGDFILNVLHSLTDILSRSGGHHLKKRYTLRPMQMASRYLRGDLHKP
jgi:pyruvate kinase